jgi:hypothetical protein
MFKWRSLIAGLAALAFMGAAPAQADLEKPAGAVILTVTGHIAKTNSPNGALFDLAMLEKLPRKTIKTTTRWTEGEQAFEGVAVTALLEFLGAHGNSIEAIGLDGYATPTMPVSDLQKYGVILALKKNGEYLQVKDKGPIWMIYPVDDFPELQQDLLTQYKLIWHLRTLVVR